MAKEPPRPCNLDIWMEFLATPPSWERVIWHSDSESDLALLNCLPKTLLDDPQHASCPLSTGSEGDPWVDLLPSVFFPDLATELESRLIQISNLDPQTSYSDLSAVFSQFGDIESIDVTNIHLSIASVKFYDLQVAQIVRQSRITIRNKNLVLLFGPQDPILNARKPPNNGTIVVFHLKYGISDELIKEEFSKFGSIRQIRSAPGKQAQKFVEFWDTRDAERALKIMKGKKLFNSKISIEFSLPGGYRKAQVPGPRLPTIERVSHAGLASLDSKR
jgi:RNA recognition motif-containing protein